jgi:hypothetical protein
MQLPSKQKTNYASMSGTTMNFNATNTNTNDGTPKVSILASASEKRMQERRRRSRLLKNTKGMGVGKKYPGVGTHHRNTKHVWLYSELAELSAAYKEHHTTMPLWAIADMLYHSFSHQVQYNQEREAKIEEEQQEAIDNDNQPIYQFQEPRVHVPSIQAIQAKLMDCISLQHNETFGVAIPSQMHGEVWSHIILAKKHREMLKQQQKQVKQEPEHATATATAPNSMRKLLRHDFLFSTDADFEATLPPAKRRKVVFEDDEDEIQQQQQPQIKQEQTEEPVPQQEQQHQQQVDELMSLLEDSHLSHQHEREIIQKLVAEIRRQNHRIGVLVANVKDAHEEIEECRENIQRKMEQIESIVNPVTPPPTSEPQTPQTQTQTNEDDEDCCGGDCDCWSEDDDDHHHHAHSNYYGEYELDYDSSGWEDQPKRGDYDHAEECS